MGDDEQRLEPQGSLEAVPVASTADHNAALERGGHIVRVTLEFGGVGAEVGIELEQVVRRHQAGQAGRRARAQPAGEGNR